MTKYIFVAGAPGSKWSSVVKNIYYSSSIDRSDYRNERTYYHDAGNPGHPELMHLGAYFDPGMEFGNFFHRLSEHDHYQCEAEFDAPFSGTGVRIIKSHVFANHIDYLKATWPEVPIVLVNRPNDACLGWWVKCGHFDITYPSYDKYYKDLRTMARIIADQNRDIKTAWDQHDGQIPANNRELAQMLNIVPNEEYFQDYSKSDLKVKVI
jgi:hypothetical protein